MTTFETILAVIAGVMMLFFLAPRIKPAMELSKQAEESHWGTVTLIAAILFAFVMVLIYMVR